MPNKTKELDVLHRFTFASYAARGEILLLQQSWQTILTQHAYPQSIALLLGEVLAATILMAATIKFKGQITTQIQSDGIISLLVAKCNHLFQIRSLARWDKQATIHNNKDLIGNGQLIVTIEQDERVKPLQSIIEIQNHNIVKSIEHYFLQSEQLPTRFIVAANKKNLKGILLQTLPSNSQLEDWQTLMAKTKKFSANKLIKSNYQSLIKYFNAIDDLRIFPNHVVEFVCNCSRERMKNALHSLSEDKADELVDGHQYVTVTCDYCNQEYHFTQSELLKQ